MATQMLGRNEIQSIGTDELFRTLAAATSVNDRVTLVTLDNAAYSVKRVDVVLQSNQSQAAVDLAAADGSIRRLSLEELRKNARSIEIEPGQERALVPGASGATEKRTIDTAEIERMDVEGVWDRLAYAAAKNSVTLTTKDDRTYTVRSVVMTYDTNPPKLAVGLESPNGRRETRHLDGLIKQIKSIDIQPLTEEQRLPNAGKDAAPLDDKSSANQRDNGTAIERALQAMQDASDPGAAIAAGVRALLGNVDEQLEAFLEKGQSQLAVTEQARTANRQAEAPIKAPSRGISR